MDNPMLVAPGEIIVGDIVSFDGVVDERFCFVRAIKPVPESRLTPPLMIALLGDFSSRGQSELRVKADMILTDGYWFQLLRLTVCPEGRFRMMKTYKELVRQLDESTRRR